MDEATTLGARVRRVRGWRGLGLRQAADRAGLSPTLWGQIERGDKPVVTRGTLEALTRCLRVHPSELTGHRTPVPSPDPGWPPVEAVSVRVPLV